MKTIRRPGASRARTWNPLKPAGVLAPLALLALGSGAAAQEETAAVLKLQEVDFFYRSSIAYFSCSDLQGRVASIMQLLGARQDVQVTVTGCDTLVAPDTPDYTWNPTNRGASSDRWGTPTDRWGTSSDRFRSSTSSGFGARRSDREQSAHIRVRLMIPVEVTPEVLDEMEKDKARRELVSRVTGNANAALDDPIVFPAQRQTITLSRKTADLEPDECELLEQMSSSVFRKLGIRVVRRGPRCDRNEISHIPPQVTVEALMPVMPTAPQLTPAPAGGESDASASAEEADSG